MITNISNKGHYPDTLTGSYIDQLVADATAIVTEHRNTYPEIYRLVDLEKQKASHPTLAPETTTKTTPKSAAKNDEKINFPIHPLRGETLRQKIMESQPKGTNGTPRADTPTGEYPTRQVPGAASPRQNVLRAENALRSG